MLHSLSDKIKKIDSDLIKTTGLKQAGRFLGYHRKLIIYLVVIGLLSYTYDMFNFSLNIDSENHASYFGAKEGWVNQGRWGMYLLSFWLLPDAVMPFTPTFIAAMGFALAAFFLVLTFSENRSAADYLATPIMIGCPVLYFALYFTTLGYGVGIAFLLATVGCFLLTRWRLHGYVAAIPLFAFAIGIYQAVLPLILVIFAFYMILVVVEHNHLRVREFCQRSAIFLVVLGMSYGVYELIKRFMLQAMGLQYDEAYLSNFIKFKPTIGYVQESLPKTLEAGVSYYTGGQSFYLYDLIVLKWLFIFCLGVTVIRLLRASRQSVLIRSLGLLALLAALAAPLAMNFMNMGDMPPRTCLSVAYVLGGLVFVAASSSWNAVRLVVGILVVACFYKFTVINNRFAFSSYMVWQADREFTSRLIDRMGSVWHKLPPKGGLDDKYPVELVGVKFRSETPLFSQREVIGSSFYNWAAGDVNRMMGLVQSMGVFDYRAASIEEKLSVAETALKMPSWPLEGAVDVVNGIIVVKIGEYNPNQIMVMCSQHLDVQFCQQNMLR